MVVKTDVCSFTDMKIYPGHGSKFVRKDGRLLSFIDNKAACLFHQKKKNGKVRWTLTWRKNHKKMKTETVAKNKTKRTLRVLRPVGGMSLEDFKKKKFEKPEVRAAARDAALREIKERNRKAKEEKSKKAVSKPAAATTAAKSKGKK